MNKLLAALAATAALLATWMPGTAGAQSARALSGQVLEAQDAGIYTYIRLKTATGEAWAAVNKAAVKKGETVTIGNPMEMRNFESKSLNRTFDRIVFGTLAAGAGAGA
ncbi:MAG TPA: nucleotide-binding protein, partial [Burkholderiaceae bacterium]